MSFTYDNFLQIFPRASGWVARYGVAVLSTGVILVICLFLDRIISGSLPLTLFIIPVAVSALFGGVGPGLLATALSGLASEYFLTEPHFSLYSMDTADMERLTLFVIASVLLCWMIKTTHIARREVETRALEAEQRQSELEAQIVERERARAERERLISELETERSRLNAMTDALQEADRRKDDFLATLAHELRNPLAPISNAVQILTLRGDDPGVVSQTKEVMERQVHQMIRLVDDLMEVSRIGRGKISLHKSSINLAEVVTTAVETSRPLIEAHSHKLSITLPERPAIVVADASRLAQVLSNLLNNAAKYTKDGGRIDLNVEKENGEIVIRVKDNGIGIAREKLPSVFEMFAQIEGSKDLSQGGLGIGLTLARRLVEMHGGKIEARSSGLGKGSEFLVRLPAMAEQSSESVQLDAKDSFIQSSKNTRRVLIVDDNVDSAESMAVLLGLQGHEIRLAYDGPSALDTAREFQPDLVFLDLDLPVLSGFEVAKRLRLEPALKNLTLIAMTGYGQEEDRQRTLEAGFNLHLVKPIDFDRLDELLSLSPDQISQYDQDQSPPAYLRLSERQPDADSDYMDLRTGSHDVVANFQP